MQIPTPSYPQIVYEANGYSAYSYPSYHVSTSSMLGRGIPNSEDGAVELTPRMDGRGFDDRSMSNQRVDAAFEVMGGAKQGEGSFTGRTVHGEAELTIETRPSIESTLRSAGSMDALTAGRFEAGGGGGMIVKVEECDEPDCWS
jgi:hypothetical protein